MPSKAAAAAAASAAAAAAEEETLTDVQIGIFARRAKEKVAQTEANSALFDKEMLDAIPKFSREELTLGKILGKGGFGTVTEVTSISVSSSDTYGAEDREYKDRAFIAKHAIREGGEEGGGDSRYCIKALSPNVVNDPHLLEQGMIDMCVETTFLSVLQHPHIIKMRAFGKGGMFMPRDYFIILDRLYDTLEARVATWRKNAKRSRSFTNKIVNKIKRKTTILDEELFAVKLSYAYDLMGAIEYLHKNKLVYRDLKPENVGFNVRDDIVLFDFGLVREVNDKDKAANGTYNLTGETGSPRYMAPEVALCKPYNYTADIYSFGIMLHEMLSCLKPFKGYSKAKFTDLVVVKGGRPEALDVWGPAVCGFLKSAWNQDITKRPDSKRASAVLKRLATQAAGGSEVQLNNFRRKSTFVNRDSAREERASLKEKNSSLSAVAEDDEDEEDDLA